MILPQFDYAAPKSVNAAVRLLADKKGSLPLAGGLSLLVELRLRRVSSPLLVDLRDVPGLRGITNRGPERGLQVGAMTTLTELVDSGLGAALVEAAASVGDLQVRNMSTLGGSLASNDPAGDLPAAVLALEGTINVAGPSGTRAVAAADFFRGAHETTLGADEIITSVDLPPPTGGSAYEKFKDPANGYAICGVAAVVVGGRRTPEYRLAASGVYHARGGKICPTCGEEPKGEATFCSTDGSELVTMKSGTRRLRAVEEALRGKDPSAQTFAAALAGMEHDGPTGNDLHASGEYRAHLLTVLGERALMRAAERARGAR